jgi:hypothetical protein
MTSRHPLFDYLQRFFQVTRVLFAQLMVLARRRWRGEPTRGHELLREGFEPQLQERPADARSRVAARGV